MRSREKTKRLNIASTRPPPRRGYLHPQHKTLQYPRPFVSEGQWEHYLDARFDADHHGLFGIRDTRRGNSFARRRSDTSNDSHLLALTAADNVNIQYLRGTSPTYIRETWRRVARVGDVPLNTQFRWRFNWKDALDTAWHACLATRYDGHRLWGRPVTETRRRPARPVTS